MRNSRIIVRLSSQTAKTIAAASRILVVAMLLFALLLMVDSVNSFMFCPNSSRDASFMARAQHKSAAGINVSVSALGADESRQSFGENLARYKTFSPSGSRSKTKRMSHSFFYPLH